MIYFDNGATTMFKPEAVWHAQEQAARRCSSVGRSGHQPALQAGETVYEARDEIAQLFGLAEPERVIFTLNATHALNTAIKGMCRRFRRVTISPFEHNSVTRPLYALKDSGVTVNVLDGGPWQEDRFLSSAERALRDGAELFIINHVSNVFGCIQPVYELDSLLKRYGVPLVLDASQSAGIVPLNVSHYSSLAAVCMPGHKGLYGPQGTGVLLLPCDILRDTLMEGGTGSLSNEQEQPDFLPDRFESGTLNVPGIAGLGAGVNAIRSIGIDKIRKYEEKLTRQLAEGLENTADTTVYTNNRPGYQTGVLSFINRKIPCETIAQRLGEMDICVRAGLHCAPLAHRSAGTFETGTIRASFSYFNTPGEVNQFIRAYRQIIEE